MNRDKDQDSITLANSFSLNGLKLSSNKIHSTSYSGYIATYQKIQNYFQHTFSFKLKQNRKTRSLTFYKQFISNLDKNPMFFVHINIRCMHNCL